MKKILLLLLTVATHPLAAQNQGSEPIQQVIKEVFEAFSSSDIKLMESVVTKDVKILEHGEVWTLDSIRFYFAKPRPSDFKRLNSFDFFQTESSENMAFVSYFNRADIHSNGRDRMIRWLESAVLVREGEKWKLKMLHSTRIEVK